MGRRLEIGSGNNPQSGYEHLDIDPNAKDVDYVADAANLDDIFEDNIFEEIISIHNLEHIPWPDIRKTLEGWYRILEPGGSLYIATPDFDYIVRKMLDENNTYREEFDCPGWHFPDPCFEHKMYWVNFKIFSGQSDGDEHKSIFTFDFLTYCLEGVGFIVERKNGSSRAIEIWARKPKKQ